MPNAHTNTATARRFSVSAIALTSATIRYNPCTVEETGWKGNDAIARSKQETSLAIHRYRHTSLHGVRISRLSDRQVLFARSRWRCSACSERNFFVLHFTEPDLPKARLGHLNKYVVLPIILLAALVAAIELFSGK